MSWKVLKRFWTTNPSLWSFSSNDSKRSDPSSSVRCLLACPSVGDFALGVVRVFYEDGFGKDYQILNLPKSFEEDQVVYITACLLKFYQQLRIYEEEAKAFEPFNLEKPLWVFVGSLSSQTSHFGWYGFQEWENTQNTNFVTKGLLVDGFSSGKRLILQFLWHCDPWWMLKKGSRSDRNMTTEWSREQIKEEVRWNYLQ